MTTTAPTWTGRMLSLGAIFLLTIPSPVLVFARPTSLQNRQELPSQFNPQANSSASSSQKIWIPIIVIALALSALAILIWCRRHVWKSVAGLARGARTAARTNASVREITAEQLAGTNSGSNSDGNNDNTTTTTTTGNRTRRNRRPRRTPSQVSTTSLPVYMKEPGEEELVIYRGPEDMEDHPMAPTTNVVMPPVDEDESVHSHSRNASQASDYPPAPDSPNDMPLLNHDDDGDDAPSPALLRSPPGEGMPTRRSTETLHTDSLVSVPSRATPEPTDPRGAAPPYFEVVDLNDSTRDLANSPSTLSEPSEPRTPPTSSGSSHPRRSAFMSLWHSIGGSGSAAQAAQTPPGSGSGLLTHTRADSGMSTNSSSNSHGSQPPRTSTSRISHRPTASNSSSILSPFRTLSRQKSTSFSTRSIHSTNNLNSPSLISLNSISSPLTHTALRTEFSYPKAGPTPEQMKLISSRESFVRFGKPYGPDAVAFAASTSMMDLSPPPEFEAVASETNLLGSGSGPSRLRADSRAASALGRGAGHARNGSDNSTLDEAPADVSDDSPSAPPEPTADPQPAEPNSNQPDTSSEAVQSLSSPSSPSTTASTTPSIPVSSPPTSVPTSPPTVSSIGQSQSAQNADASQLKTSITPIPPTTPTGLTPPTAPTAATQSAPPSSFRNNAPFRPESRASSMVSFATAAETLPPSTPAPPSDSEEEGESDVRRSLGSLRRKVDVDSESDVEEGNTVGALGIDTSVSGRGKRGTLIVESPSTPVMKASASHVQEGTDATITQDSLHGVDGSKAGSRQSTLSTMTVVPKT